MNAVAEHIDVEFPLQFKSGSGCSNVDMDVRVDIWRNQSLRVLNFNTLFDLGFTLFCCE